MAGAGGYAVTGTPHAAIAAERTAARRGHAQGVALVAASLAFALWAFAATRLRMDPLAPHPWPFLHPALLASVALLAGAFLVALFRGGAPRWLLGGHVVLLAAMLHLTPFLVEGIARWRTNWRNYGYSEFFARNLHADPSLIWYHNWPGFFIESWHLAEALGRDANLFLGTNPFFLTLLLLPVVGTFFSVLFRGDAVATACATWLFLAANWVNQEAFGPQAFALAVFLALILLTRDQARPREERLLPSRAGGRVLIVVLYAAASVLHPLTAAFYAVGLLLLATKRRSERRLALVTAVLFLAWLVFGAYAYLLSNLGEYVGELGKVTSIFTRGFGPSLRSSDAGVVVALSRIGFSAAFMALGGVAVLLRRPWRNPEEHDMFLWAGVPAVFLGAFSYGGEIFLRVFLFALAPLCYFVVAAARACARRSAPLLARLPRARVGRRAALGTLGAGLVAFAVLHLPVHYGQEYLEFVHEREVVGMMSFYERAEASSRVITMPHPDKTLISVAEAVSRDRVGFVYWSLVEWRGNVLDWSAAAPSSGSHYVWLGDGDWQYLDYRLDDKDAFAATYERLLASPYGAVYDSGGLRVFHAPAERAREVPA